MARLPQGSVPGGLAQYKQYWCAATGFVIQHVSALQGGFSEVQLAQDKLTGKQVALKIIFLNRPGLTTQQVSGSVLSCKHCLKCMAIA